jgi:hypothetical protein
MSQLNVETVPVGYAGLDTEAAADSVFEGAAPDLANFLVHHERKSVLRGPLANHNELPIGEDEIIAGIWSRGQVSLIAVVDKSASAVRDPWRAPLRNSTAAELADPELTMKLVNFLTMSVVDVTTTLPYVIGGNSVTIGGTSYGFAYSGNTTDLTSRGEVRRRSLLAWDGTATPPSVVVDAPDSGLDLKVHYNRLFTLGGRDVAGSSTTHEFNALYYSDAGGPISADANSWRGPTGLSNKIIIDADDIDDYGVGLAKVGQDLAILKRNSLHILTGYDSDTFALQTFSSDVGCVDQRSIVEHSDGFCFMSDEGYMYCDGSQLTNVTQSLRTEIVTAVHNSVGDGWVDGGRCEAIKLPNHYALITITQQEMTTGDLEAGAAYLFHEPTSRWSRFSSDATNFSVPVGVGRNFQTPFIFDGDHVVQIPHITLPEAADETDRGFDSVAGVSQRIPARWRSRLVRLGTPQYMSQVHRMLFDYNFVIVDGADDSDYGWFITVRNGTGTAVQPQYQVPVMGDPADYLYRRRHVQDCFSEASDVQVTVEWKDDGTGTTPAVKTAEIYDSYVEYQISRQRRST